MKCKSCGKDTYMLFHGGVCKDCVENQRVRPLARRHRCKRCGKTGLLKPESKVFVCGYCKRREKV
jgi:hypothetical protein